MLPVILNTLCALLFCGSPNSGSIITSVSHATQTGQCVNGAIDLEIPNGSGPFDYYWESPTFPSFESNEQDIDQLYSGIYCVTVIDALCGVASLCDTVECLDLSISAKITHANMNGYCDGNGSIELNIHNFDSTLCSPLTIDWLCANCNPPYSSMSEDINNLRPGIYSVTVSDDCSQVVTDSFEVVCCPDALEDVIIEPNHICIGTTGSITFTTPSMINYQYDWLDSDSNIVSNLNQLTAGIYTLHAYQPDDSCEYFYNHEIKDCSISFSLDTIKNPHDEVLTDGLIGLNISSSLPYSVTWHESPQGYCDDSIGTGDLIQGLPGGQYCAVITNGCCTRYASYRLEPCFEYDPIHGGHPLLLPIEIDTIDFCYESEEGLCDGYIKVEVTKNGPPIVTSKFTWTGPVGVISSGYSSSSISEITNLCPGVYCFEVDNGCFNEEFCFNLESCSDSPITVTDVIQHTCTNIDFGKIDLSITGGTPPYKIQWSNGKSTENINRLFAGTYSVTITDTTCCAITKEYVVQDQGSAMEQYVGNCKFKTFCGTKEVEHLRRKGVLDTLLLEDECAVQITCYDESLPNGKDVLVPSSYLEQFPKFLPDTNSSGCRKAEIYCKGLDFLKNTADDSLITDGYGELKTIEIMGDKDGDERNCQDCWRVQICDYSDLLPLDHPENERFYIKRAKSKWSVEYCPPEYPGDNIDICYTTNPDTQCLVKVRCHLDKNESYQKFWFSNCIPTDLCSSDKFDSSQVAQLFNICTDTPTINRVVIESFGFHSTLGIKHLLSTGEESSIIVIPNPNLGQFKIDINDENIDLRELKSLKIINSYGKEIASSYKPNNSVIEVNLEQLPTISGVHFIIVRLKDRDIISKFVYKSNRP